MTKTKKKRIWLRILLPIVGLMAAAFATLLFINMFVNAPTTGSAIPAYDSPKAALLVIDVQNDTTNNTDLYDDTTAFVENVNNAIALAETQGMEILYVKNEYEGNPLVSLLAGGRYQPGSEGAELDARLQVLNDSIFTKSVGDSFSSATFEAFLAEKQVDTLYIAGADAAACVLSTARGGLNRGYQVNILGDAIITVDDATMSTMLATYEDLGINVMETKEMAR